MDPTYLISLFFELTQNTIEDFIPALERLLKVPVGGLSSDRSSSICVRVKGGHKACEERLEELDE